MSKNKSIYDLSGNGVQPIQVVTDHVNKNGKLTGSKKEKKALASICEHHLISKKGKKVRAKLDVHGKNCQCRICKETMPTEFFSEQDYDKAYAPYKGLLSQAKLMAAATNANLKTQQEVCELNLRADRFKKVYGNLKKVAEKQDEVGKKKKKGKKNQSTYGAWQVRR